MTLRPNVHPPGTPLTHRDTTLDLTPIGIMTSMPFAELPGAVLWDNDIVLVFEPGDATRYRVRLFRWADSQHVTCLLLETSGPAHGAATKGAVTLTREMLHGGIAADDLVPLSPNAHTRTVLSAALTSLYAAAGMVVP